MAKLVRDELKYLIFSEIYLHLDEPKARRKAYTLLEASLKCFAKKGFDEVTLEMIAREAGVTRPLITHYFENAEELKMVAIKYVRLLFQKFVLEAMEKANEPDRKLSAYVSACFTWVENHRTHAAVWLAFMQRCTRQSKLRKLNTEAVRTGEKRIAALLGAGTQQEFFKCSDPETAARAIQVVITGGILSLITEDFDDPKQFPKFIERRCLSIAGATRVT